MKQRLLYINIDGFGRYYFDGLKDGETRLPGISELIARGVFFENAFTGVPAITYPMQSAIVSGGYSDVTGNCFAMLDRKRNVMEWQRRYNRAQTVGELMKEQGLTTLSIQQFALEGHGCTADDPQHLYIQPGGDCRKRFGLLLDMLRNRPEQELPDGIFLYLDDLDSIGHNPPACGAPSESERVANVQKRLCEIDGYIALLLELLDSRGLYESTYILLTTDHGMISYRGSKTDELRQALLRYGFGSVEITADNAAVQGRPEVILTGHSVQCQLYFDRFNGSRQKLKEYLLELPFVEQVLTGEELVRMGVAPGYADMVISPVEGESLAPQKGIPGYLHASHDSLHEKCRHIFGVAAGAGLKQGYIEKETVCNIDFIPTILQLMGLPPLRDGNGRIINTIIE